MSSSSGQEGNFGATPLSLSHGWQVSIGSGEFAWSYDIPVPAAPAGESPSVALSYSSGAIDGLVSSRNTQGGQAGVGWGDLASNFIERRYIPCSEKDPGLEALGDLCWHSDNAVISLNGVTSELVRVPGVWGWVYRLKNDPGWTVERRNAFIPNGDNDGEHWVVKTPDGTEYWFGYGLALDGDTNPDNDWDNPQLNSTWSVPVFANGIDPCASANMGWGWCQQGWRWNLDRVIDPHGNATTYKYIVENNRYGLFGGSSTASYVRAGRLEYIDYGQRFGSSQAATARVLVGAEYRCTTLSSSCPAPTNGASGFHDVPVDMICTSSSYCPVITPTFFTGKRYTWVSTNVRVDGTLQQVDVVTIGHGWHSDGDGNQRLLVNGIQRTGKVSTNLSLPAVNFLYTWLDNRVDYNLSLGVPRMRQARLGAIVDEYGALTQITYTQPNPCSQNPYPNGGWDTNDKDCFPQMWKPPGSPAGFAIFHKYLTGVVEVTDTTGGSPSSSTHYTYSGGAGWHHDADVFVGLDKQSWSDWRGYATVLEFSGAGYPVTTHRLFRGLNGDRLAGGGSKSVSTISLDGSVTTPDDNWLAGLVLDKRRFAANWTTVLESELTQYQARETATPGTDAQRWARWVDEDTTTTSTRTPLAGFVKQQRIVTFDADLRPATVFESGWLNENGDERCTKLTYASNPWEGMLNYKASETLVEGSCTSTEVRSQAEWYYDGLNTLGEVGTKGDVTKSRSRINGSTWTPFQTTTYDALGRPTVVTDERGHSITTAHTPASGYPTTTTVTNELGHAEVTNWQVHRGLPLELFDANGNKTSYGYDPLGRVTRMRQPTEQPFVEGKPPTVEVSYIISGNKTNEPVVRTRRTTSEGLDVFEDDWVVYDSLLRERQKQVLSPASGKVVVTEKAYDARGDLVKETFPQAVTGSPGDRITGITWQNARTFEYDELGRVVEENYLRGSTEAWDTSTVYTHNSVEVTPPEGGPTLSVMDAYGRTVQVSEHDGADWQSTSYTHDLAGNLTSVTDPAGNVISYTYDMLGQRLSQDDPDSGVWTYTYDPVGNQTSVTDAEGTAIHTVYDALDRPVERRKDSPTGQLLVSQSYDASGEKGLLDKATRHAAGGNWVSDVVGYDGRERATGTMVTVPASAGPLAGSYTTSMTYDRADRVTSISHPAVGDLPAETVTTTYNSLGLAETLIGAENYVWGMTYDDRGRPSLRSSGSQTNWVAQHWTYDADQRLSRLEGATPTTVLMDHELTYDDVGNITERESAVSGQTWRECFDHDPRQRLVGAYTVAATASCASGTPGTGDNGYEHSYQYSPDGNLLSRTEDSATDTYTYPSAGSNSVRPHAPTAVGSDTYEWDENGNLVERTVGGDTETFAWSAERLLESVTGSEGTTSFQYGPDGQRVLRTEPDGDTTLYVGAHEVTADSSGVHTTRTYSFNGQLVATRTADGVEYLLSDQQGSVNVSVPSGATNPSGARTYLPYGGSRHESGDGFATDRGWIGQVEDDATDLSYLNARYYDATLGRFISPDPLYDASRPQTLNPYAYGLGNPTTNADASGLLVPVGARSERVYYHARWNKGKGGFTGSHKALIKYNISPKAVTPSYRKNYTPKWNAHQRNLAALCAANCSSAYWQNIAFWHRLATDKHFAKTMRDIATLREMAATGLSRAQWREIATWVANGGKRPRANSVGSAGAEVTNAFIDFASDRISSATTCAAGEVVKAYIGANCSSGSFHVDDPIGGAINWAWENRSTLLAVGVGVVCTVAAAPTAGASVVACVTITASSAANATASTVAALRQCGWQGGVAVGVYEYSAAMPGGVAAGTGERVAVAVASGHSATLAAIADANGLESCG